MKFWLPVAALALTACESGTVYETATITLANVRCSEQIRIDQNDGGRLGVTVSSAPATASDPSRGTVIASASIPVNGGKQSTVEQRCQDILDEAKKAAKLEVEEMAVRAEILRLERELTALKVERERIELDHAKNGIMPEW